MGEQMLRFIVNEVNKILKTDYNMISFDSLSKNALLQIFVDCLAKIDAFTKFDVSKNTDEAMTKLVKYFSDIKVPMPMGVDVNDFADGFIQGKRNILQYTLHWILSNQEEVKKRSYLAKYLIKVDINPMIANDPDIEPLLEQYEELIQEFKKVYAQTTRYSKIAKVTVELRNEIEKQSKDLTNILDLINKQKAKMENIPNKETLLVSVKALRSELTAEKTLIEQIEKQTGLIAQLENNLRIAYDDLKEQRMLRQASGGPLNRIQEEVQTSRMIVQERLPHELEALQNQMNLVEEIATDHEPSEIKIAAYQEKVDQATQDIQIIIERTKLFNDPRDEKLAQFRQHAAVIANNKQLATEQYMELKEEFGLIYRQIEEKEAELQNIIGGTLPQGEDLKNFVGKLRAQSVVYKESRAKLLEVQAEVSVLARTQDILQQEEPTLAEVLQNKNDNDNINEEEIPKDVSVMKQKCKELVTKINILRSDVSTIRKDLQNTKDNMDDLVKIHQTKKEVYDAELQSYEKSVNKLEQEIKKLEENLSKEEGKWKEIKRLIDEKELLLDDLYKESMNKSKDKKTQADILNQAIKEMEAKHQELEDEIQKTEKDKEDREEQVNLWHSTLRVLQCKKENCL